MLQIDIADPRRRWAYVAARHTRGEHTGHRGQVRTGRQRRNRRGGATRVLLAVAMVLSSGCGGESASDVPTPPVGEIAGALAAVVETVDGQPVFFEVSANLARVRVIQAEGWSDGTGQAVAFDYSKRTLSEPQRLGQGNGQVFPAEAVDFDPKTIFSAIRRDLGDVLITDFAATGAPGGAAIYDATVRSAKGGQLRIRLDRNGKVLEVSAG